MSEIMSRRDLEFLLHEWLDVEALTARDRFADHSRETFDGVLGLSERLATDLFAPHNRAADLAEPTWDGQDVHLLPEVKKAVNAYAAADLLHDDYVEEYPQSGERIRGKDIPRAIYDNYPSIPSWSTMPTD